jgi:hypothetical protein
MWYLIWGALFFAFSALTHHLASIPSPWFVLTFGAAFISVVCATIAFFKRV